MRQAEIEQVGTPIEIYTSPRTHFVATFIGTTTQFDGVLEDRASGRVRFEDQLLVVSPDLPSEFQNGDRVVVFVRPEAIEVARPGEEIKGENKLTARLETVTLLGPVIRLSLKHGDFNLLADVNTNERSRFSLGEEVLISFPAEACRLMKEDET